MFVDQGIDWRMLSVGDGSRHPKFGGNNSPQTVTGQHRRGDCPCGGLGDLEAASDTEDMVEVIVSNALMRYPTCYVLVYDGDSAVNWAAFNQLVTSKGLHHFNGFGRSADALLSRPAQLPSLGSNGAGGAAKPEVGSFGNILFYRLREALCGQVVIHKLVCVCVSNRTVKHLNEDKATKKATCFNIFIRQSPDLNEDTHRFSL